MRTALSLTLIWFVGIRDLTLTAQLIRHCGVSAELNPLARDLASVFGGAALPALKLSALLVVSLIVVRVRRETAMLARMAARLSCAVSVALAVWWVAALGNVALFLGFVAIP